MMIKAEKSRSLSIKKGVLQNNTFHVGAKPIPQLAEQPLKSLGRLNTADLSDKQIGKFARQQLAEGLAKIDQSQLPRKYKLWCCQHTLYHRVMWPLKVCKLPLSKVSRMDSLANNYIRKWLGFSDASLFGQNMLELPMKSISLGYKQEKACLILETLVRSAKSPSAQVLSGKCRTR